MRVPDYGRCCHWHCQERGQLRLEGLEKIKKLSQLSTCRAVGL